MVCEERHTTMCLQSALVNRICRRKYQTRSTLLYSLHLPYAILVHHLDHIAGRRNHQPLLHFCNALQWNQSL